MMVLSTPPNAIRGGAKISVIDFAPHSGKELPFVVPAWCFDQEPRLSFFHVEEAFQSDGTCVDLTTVREGAAKTSRRDRMHLGKMRHHARGWTRSRHQCEHNL